MSIKVRIPSQLRRLSDGEAELTVNCSTVDACLTELSRRYPELSSRIKDDDGELRRFVNVYVNGEDIRFLSGLETPVRDGDEVSIVPALAGGQ